MTRRATVEELDRELAAQAAAAQASIAAAQAETVVALNERDAARAQVQELEQRQAELYVELHGANVKLEEARRQVFWVQRLRLGRLVARPDGRIARIAQAVVRSGRAEGAGQPGR